ncbi:prolipoprotein diacylglyceryl transferase [Barrientosiimonas humi]|uniref:Phosphatidylglycerol--prolipoprotein diacylglyceryl transferase n=1 Tax=Barrientosiimonas humi TaxID=999931 RepID=A0A542XBX1_9MICO|nr:prolipoprotein diacylglyceryl transferase [Barrientosiimonas humi]TQL33339.1 prolipoprotein diacylglyceryl transferase [Barrientosiimonas humi]CAG7573328.1 Prolipoprotein diacylglyceryl transferase [Barrientosiimonas humi]
MTAALPASIPSPTSSILWLGPLPLRAYALCILAGIAVAIWLCGRRLADRGYDPDEALNVAYWGVPFGILGGRIYHVITTPQPYFGEGGRPLDAVKIWEGGLGIWGAVALGAVGVWIGCRRAGISFLDYADAAVPGVAIAQAMGRVGNYFNNELYGEPTTVPWALEIHRMGSDGQALRDAAGQPIVEGYFHPTFLYEAIWCLVMAAIILLLDRRGVLRRGQSLALYVLLYPMGRIVFELMRTDPANRILGLRVNVWMSMIVFLLGVTLFWLWRRNPPRPRGGEEPAEDVPPTAERPTS